MILHLFDFSNFIYLFSCSRVVQIGLAMALNMKKIIFEISRQRPFQPRLVSSIFYDISRYGFSPDKQLRHWDETTIVMVVLFIYHILSRDIFSLCYKTQWLFFWKYCQLQSSALV